jgi:hypothetical protein
MKKLTRKSLDELAKVMPVISEDEQRCYVGGTDSYYYYGTGYYGDTGYFGDTGYYGGSGYSDGSEYGITGYYSDAMYYSESGYSYGNYAGTIYTREEYEAMRISGSWSGGVIEGSGYISGDMVITGSLFPTRYGYFYGDLAEYAEHTSKTGWELFLGRLLGLIPGTPGMIASAISGIADGMADRQFRQVIIKLNNTRYDGPEGFYVNAEWDYYQGQFCTHIYSRNGEHLYKFY